MRWLLMILLALYPRAWRQRYEDEFRALLEQCDLSLFDLIDIALGGLDARVRGFSWRISIPQTAVLLTSLCALFSFLIPVMVFVTPISQSEESAEFWIIISPLVLAPVVREVHLRYKRQAAGRSSFVARVGYVGTLALPLYLGLYALLSLFNPSNALLNAVYLSMASFTGLWMILACNLGVEYRLMGEALGLVGVAAGCSWMVLTLSTIFGMVVPSFVANFGILLSLNIFIWVVSHVFWTGGMVLWLLRGRAWPSQRAV
ncbi:MAG: hypothetical protein OHK0046_36280 [Anaerolineae bacterium]